MDERLNDLVEAAEDLGQEVERFTSGYMAMAFGEGIRHPHSLVTARCLRRQVEAVKATCLLARNSMGHLAVCLLRPACEEYLWLAYLSTLDKNVANSLIAHMSTHDGYRAIRAQQQYFGKREMKLIGFPAKYVNAIPARHANVERKLRDLGARLQWPTGENSLLPPTAWIAAQAGQSKLYDYLYSATSRAVHFSPMEVIRGNMASPNADGVLTLPANHDPNHVRYRGTFALYWMCHLLILTVPVVYKVLGKNPESPQIEIDTRYLEIANRIAGHGKAPIVISAEMQLEIQHVLHLKK
ncbi:DUF5677 domain-containing protein [Nonomuraea sp. NPDC049646]|uniref:DUF5677 domain-containing protein n=1 Tax=unclassified Nonomuraea TaxID=2593643 RepID=UPI0037AE1C9E